MELGELVAEEIELQNRMLRLQRRLLDPATLQQDDTHTLDPTPLFAEYRNLADDHEEIVRWISARVSLLGFQARRNRV